MSRPGAFVSLGLSSWLVPLTAAAQSSPVLPAQTVASRRTIDTTILE